MKTFTSVSIAVALTLLIPISALAQNTFKKYNPATLICRGGPALSFRNFTERGPPRADRVLITFLRAPRPVSAQGIGLGHSQCGLQGLTFPGDRHLNQVLIDQATSTFKTTTGTYAPVTRTTSIRQYLGDINNFWRFEVSIDVTQYSADFTPQRHPLQTSTHGRLELPKLVDAPRTPGSPLDRAKATTGKTGPGPGGSQQASQQPSQQTRIDPSSTVVLNPQPLPPRTTTVLQPRDGTTLTTGPMQTTSADHRQVDPQSQIQGAARGYSTGALGDGMQSLLCRGGKVQGIGPYPTKADMQMMYFAPAEEPARADGSGLPPERCAFADRPVADVDPKIVLFPATQTEGARVSKLLESADVYWLFLVRQNESSYYEATAHEQLQTENTKSRTAANPFTRLRVTPGPNNVVFTFEGAPHLNPRIMVVNGPLTLTPAGQYMWVGPPLHLKAAKSSSVNQAGNVEFIASSDLHRDPRASDEWLTLIPGAQYHYSLFNEGSSPMQEGDFETTQGMINPSREGTLEVERATPIKSTVLAPATSTPPPATSMPAPATSTPAPATRASTSTTGAPIPATQRLPGR